MFKIVIAILLTAALIFGFQGVDEIMTMFQDMGDKIDEQQEMIDQNQKAIKTIENWLETNSIKQPVPTPTPDIIGG